MAEPKKLTPLEYLRQFSPGATTAFDSRSTHRCCPILLPEDLLP